MTQVWLHTNSTHGEMAIRADYISALYETRDAHTPRGVGRPWRIEAAVIGLPSPVVLLTAADLKNEAGPAFKGALPAALRRAQRRCLRQTTRESSRARRPPAHAGVARAR